MLYKEVAEELLKMEAVDEKMRQKNLKNSDSWDYEVDQKHTNSIKEIISKIGWPTISKVGREAAHAAWLLVHHSDHDVSFQEECLILMKSFPENEVQMSDIAYLEDRVRVNTNQPQMYGTQFDRIRGDFAPKPMVNPEQVDERRLRMGLDTLQDAIGRMLETFPPRKK